MARRREFPPVKDGEWVQPIMRGYYMACCDCGLVHRMDFRIVRGELDGGLVQRVQFRAFRAPNKTRALRGIARAGKR